MARYWYAIDLVYAGAICNGDELLRFASKKQRDKCVDDSWDDERYRFTMDSVTREYAEYAFPDAFDERVWESPWVPSRIVEGAELAINCCRRVD